MDSGWTLASPRMPDGRDLIRRWQQTPGYKAHASRLLNNEAREIASIAKEIAEQDLRRRPAERRTKESLAHGAEYHDSFEIVPAREQGDGIRVSIRNTHPAAKIIEDGSVGHEIKATGGKKLAFPYIGRRATPPLGGPRRPNTIWSLDNAPTVFPRKVDHPGTGAFKIMARAVRTYRRRRRGAINGRQV